MAGLDRRMWLERLGQVGPTRRRSAEARTGKWFDPIVHKAACLYAPEDSSVDDMAQEAYVHLYCHLKRFFETDEPTMDDFKLAKAAVHNKLRGIRRRERRRAFLAPTMPLLEPDQVAGGERVEPRPEYPPSRLGRVAAELAASEGFGSFAEAASALGEHPSVVGYAVKLMWGGEEA